MKVVFRRGRGNRNSCPVFKWVDTRTVLNVTAETDRRVARQYCLSARRACLIASLAGLEVHHD